MVRGNIIDLTAVGKPAPARAGLDLAASDVTASDNQVSVRGEVDPNVTGIRLSEPAINLLVHDNLVRTCGHGIVARPCRSSVTEVGAHGTFLESALPLEWPVGHRYRGWNLVWLGGANTDKLCTIAEFDAETCRFRLEQPLKISVGDSFAIFPPSANWTLHSNTIADCRRPVALDGYGSPTSVFRQNPVTRGWAADVAQAVTIAGEYKLIGNHLQGVDEPESAALVLLPCRAGKTLRNVVLDNVFENCVQPVQERAKSLWAAATKHGNTFLDCPSAEQTEAAPAEPIPAAFVPAEATRHALLEAGHLAGPIAVDGSIDEWPWTDPKRAMPIRYTPTGDELLDSKGRLCAA
ncbi:MAG: hypothetical protein CO096_25470 [Armatimonadetes bacterium CG_4_9_14_3_um_filter_66_14]|nr:hypothetical protein [Armatimonadota bacterium]NCQ31005.1 hypothetical protein [Armatimonadota bacterium]PIU91708.1 MAG: hypothetical protein COS65_21135 [Armatimonadetes bacterium CG06_land_8_20_14_3_00_66_21]PJB62454.1 MAG: hypothetical protein CO096_25470 [Armatimonadetes bacterium CG_4_9_14_3_um_filter_66_14]